MKGCITEVAGQILGEAELETEGTSSGIYLLVRGSGCGHGCSSTEDRFRTSGAFYQQAQSVCAGTRTPVRESRIVKLELVFYGANEIDHSVAAARSLRAFSMSIGVVYFRRLGHGFTTLVICSG